MIKNKKISQEVIAQTHHLRNEGIPFDASQIGRASCRERV